MRSIRPPLPPPWGKSLHNSPNPLSPRPPIPLPQPIHLSRSPRLPYPQLPLALHQQAAFQARSQRYPLIQPPAHPTLHRLRGSHPFRLLPRRSVPPCWGMPAIIVFMLPTLRIRITRLSNPALILRRSGAFRIPALARGMRAIHWLLSPVIRRWTPLHFSSKIRKILLLRVKPRTLALT